MDPQEQKKWKRDKYHSSIGIVLAKKRRVKRGYVLHRGEDRSDDIRVTNARVYTIPHPPFRRRTEEVNAVARHFAIRSDAIQTRPMQVYVAAPVTY